MCFKLRFLIKYLLRNLHIKFSCIHIKNNDRKLCSIRLWFKLRIIQNVFYNQWHNDAYNRHVPTRYLCNIIADFYTYINSSLVSCCGMLGSAGCRFLFRIIYSICSIPVYLESLSFKVVLIYTNLIVKSVLTIYKRFNTPDTPIKLIECAWASWFFS